MSSTHGGKGSKRRPESGTGYTDNWDTIFGKKIEVKTRKVTPPHSKSQVHSDKTKYDRKTSLKLDVLRHTDC
jgi:hypothetical protein